MCVPPVPIRSAFATLTPSILVPDKRGHGIALALLLEQCPPIASMQHICPNRSVWVSGFVCGSYLLTSYLGLQPLLSHFHSGQM